MSIREEFVLKALEPNTSLATLCREFGVSRKTGYKWPSPVPKRCTFHELRHTTATLLLAAGAELWAVQKMLRHTDAQVTTDRYASFCFGVIGEAARHIPEDVVAANPDLPWPEMRAMRNVVVHEYFGVTQETLWKTAREDLPALVERLRRLLAEPEP